MDTPSPGDLGWWGVDRGRVRGLRLHAAPTAGLGAMPGNAGAGASVCLGSGVAAGRLCNKWLDGMV